ncbi:MAG: heparinase II/III family protein [Anaerolineaceae bacterium]
MRKFSRLQILIKTPAQLGWKSVTQYALYQAGLRSGYFKARTRQPDIPTLQTHLPASGRSLLPSVPADELKKIIGSGISQLMQEADALLDGKIILFDEIATQLDLSPHTPLLHWSTIERGKFQLEEDIKFIWEPARFSWAFTLAKAFHLSGDTRYREAFKSYLDIFNRLNPAYLGANWTSGQEAALRIIALSFAHHIFSQSPHIPADYLQSIKNSIAVNAARIPLTLCYARSQRNNHLISEAVGLYTAGLLLDGYAPAKKWKRIGWKVFNQAVLDQIAQDGTYIQHSANYHRLMLDESLWMAVLANHAGEELPDSVKERVALSTEFLFGMLDPVSGHAPNLGHQDGSNILPLAAADHLDYRATLQAASRVFLQKEAFKAGVWDEKSCWLGIAFQKEFTLLPTNPLRLGSTKDWASMRAVHYHSRPAHADQLHIEIWHAGQNLALDAGTYLYNVAAPWRNAFRTTRVHNTLTVDGLDQMLPTSRFMWLDWANAEVLATSSDAITARHAGYKKLGITHQRTLQHAFPSGWEITDEVLFSSPKTHQIALHWLLPDLSFTVQKDSIHFKNPTYTMRFSNERNLMAAVQVIRAGAFVYGQSDMDTTIYGWFSPTYGVKQAALSVLYTLQTDASIILHTVWEFSEN